MKGVCSICLLQLVVAALLHISQSICKAVIFLFLIRLQARERSGACKSFVTIRANEQEFFPSLVSYNLWCHRFKRILVLISHSQDFLNGVCTNIIHMHNRKLKYYTVSKWCPA